MRHPLRKHAVAGYFYPRDPETLRREIKGFLEGAQAAPEGPSTATAAIVPHAGYMYSGHVAATVYARLVIPERVIILGPNHTGLGAQVSINASGAWEMPLGQVPIDVGLAAHLAKSDLFTDETQAHIKEHAIEVQLPFLQVLQPRLAFVPITLGYLPYPACEALGKALADTIQDIDSPILILASSDMNHYESQEITEKKDALAIQAIQDLDSKGLYTSCRETDISMCGVIPATVALIAAKALGAGSAELVKHATSGDVSGDYEHVVGYAGLIISHNAAQRQPGL